MFLSYLALLVQGFLLEDLYLIFDIALSSIYSTFSVLRFQPESIESLDLSDPSE